MSISYSGIRQQMMMQQQMAGMPPQAYGVQQRAQGSPGSFYGLVPSCPSMSASDLPSANLRFLHPLSR
jgi:hypothetical protein